MLNDALADLATLLKVNEEVSRDPNRPRVKQVNILDDVDVELTYLEMDNMVEMYFEQYRDRFRDVKIFEALRETHRVKFREYVASMVIWGREQHRKMGTDPQDWEGIDWTQS